MIRLNIYNINNEYIQYLSQFDLNIDFNAKNNSKHMRPYIGIVLEINDYYYFAPLKSPKTKFSSGMKKHIDIVLIEDGKKGVINLNDMIPIAKYNVNVLKKLEYNINNTDTIEDIKYKNLIQDQIEWCNKIENKTIILKKAKRLYYLYEKLPKYNKLKVRCCNYKLLEKKAIDYK